MRIIGIIVLFFSFYNLGYSQTLNIPPFETNATHGDTLDYSTLFDILNKYDFSISEVIYVALAAPKEREYKVIAYKKGKWHRFNLYQPFHYVMGKPDTKFLLANDSECKLIFDKMIESQLLSMNEDSLDNKDKMADGNDEGMTVVDGSSYSFFIMIPGHFRIITSDNPDEYYKWNPSVLQRKKFIDFRDIFEKCWQK